MPAAGVVAPGVVVAGVVVADQVHPVELQGELDNRLVAVDTDTAQDLGDRLMHIGAGIGRARKDVIEGRQGTTQIEQPEGHEDPRLLAMRDPPGRRLRVPVDRGEPSHAGGIGLSGPSWPPWSG